MTDTPLDLSIIIPFNNEEENVPLLVPQILKNVQQLDKAFEIILVDDGSEDETAARIAELEKNHPEVRGIYFVRNYGQTAAIQAGFDHASGDLIVTMDGDLQNDPADIPKMLQFLETSDADVVSGWRKNRKDGWMRVWVSRLANRLIAGVTGVAIKDFGCSLKIYRREVLDKIRLLGEMHRFLPVLLTEVGARVVEMEVSHHPRQHGRSNYGLDRTFRVLLDILLIMFLKKYLHRPLHFFGQLGFVALVPGLVISLYLSGLWVFAGESIGSRPLLLLGVLLILIGVLLIAQGLLGEIMVRVLYGSSAGWPQYILKDHKVTEKREN